MRCYALSCDMVASKEQTMARAPSFAIEKVTSCPDSNAVGTKSLELQNPFWLFLDTTRSSREFLSDLMNDRVHHIVMCGHPCAVRSVTKAEQSKLHKHVPGVKQGRLIPIVICDERNVAGFEEEDCVPPHVHAVSMSSVSSWPDLIPERSRTQQNDGTASTLLHVWGYGNAR